MKKQVNFRLDESTIIKIHEKSKEYNESIQSFLENSVNLRLSLNRKVLNLLEEYATLPFEKDIEISITFAQPKPIYVEFERVR